MVGLKVISQPRPGSLWCVGKGAVGMPDWERPLPEAEHQQAAEHFFPRMIHLVDPSREYRRRPQRSSDIFPLSNLQKSIYGSAGLVSRTAKKPAIFARAAE